MQGIISQSLLCMIFGKYTFSAVIYPLLGKLCSYLESAVSCLARGSAQGERVQVPFLAVFCHIGKAHSEHQQPSL